ncbi:MAG: hypothetical protein IKD88_04440 [Lachnospiraceae bacterium]|nr:hypothetical protein [Lachnospiraceae bacterium]
MRTALLNKSVPRGGSGKWIGIAGAAGITFSAYSLAGALGSLLVKLLQNVFRRQLITVCTITCGAGMLVVIIARTPYWPPVAWR